MGTPMPRPTVAQICSNLKQSVMNCCYTLNEKRKEQVAFAQDPISGIKQNKSEFGTFDEDDQFQQELGHGEGGGGQGEKITNWQAGWNVTNAIQGMFLVSLPYSVLHGGYWAIVAMVGVAYICYYTGKILVECLYEEDENGIPVRVRDSYMAIAKEGFGEKLGPPIVNTAQVIELLMTCILYVVLCGDLLIGTFPDSPIDARSWMMICGMVLIPCAFLRTLTHVSTLSFWCTVAHVLVNLIIVAYCLACIGQWELSAVQLTLDMDTFPISLGIIVFSYTSHIFLPTLEGNMNDPSEFKQMLNWSHVAAAAFKSGFGYICFLTWRKSTLQVITNNLPILWKSLVNIILVSKAILSYPLPYFAAAELIEKVWVSNYTEIWDKRDRELTTRGCAYRVGLVLVTILMAISIPHFSILMGFIGNFTGTMLSFIWPAYFHLKLKGGQLSLGIIAWDCFIIFLGVLFGVVGIYDSGKALSEAFAIGLPF